MATLVVYSSHFTNQFIAVVTLAQQQVSVVSVLREPGLQKAQAAPDRLFLGGKFGNPP
ncbi:MAG: hypothetical protein GY802_09025 [Gammaproteobacteria bacterium]|nr:hypothetical protein [Gammaproteobacteria bacterium]